MKELSLRITFAAVLAVVFMFGQAGASARRTEAEAPRFGVVTAIDRANRVIVVEELPGGRTCRIRVPKNAKIATIWSPTRGSSVSFELLQVGLQYRGIVPE